MSGQACPEEILILTRWEGDHAALLESYRPYLAKWSRLLRTGRWERTDAEIRHFLKMLGSVDQTAGVLVRLLKAYDPEDLEQELILALLQTARRYPRLTDGFRYILKQRVRELISDPLVFSREPGTLAEAVARPAAELGEAWVQGIDCDRGFDRLEVEERRALQQHHYVGLTLEQTARTMDTTVWQVRRLLESAKSKLAAAGIG